jgi:hypothetical protein
VFGRIKKVIDNVQKLNVNKIAAYVYWNKDFQKIVLSYQRIDQLTHGLNTEGGIIGVYSPTTFALARLQGQQFTFDGQRYQKLIGEPYNFVDTGEFLGSFEIIVAADGFYFYADDKKDKDNLADKYPNLLGLTDENKDKLAEAILPLFTKTVREKIFAT